jgi:hypothetical protein
VRDTLAVVPVASETLLSLMPNDEELTVPLVVDEGTVAVNDAQLLLVPDAQTVIDDDPPVRPARFNTEPERVAWTTPGLEFEEIENCSVEGLEILMLVFCPTGIIGLVLLSVMVEVLTVPALATTTPQALISVEHTRIDEEPIAAVAVKFNTDPLMLAGIIFAFEFRIISYEPFPPNMVMGSVWPLVTETLLRLKESWEAFSCATIIYKMGQGAELESSHTVIVVVPGTTPSMVIPLPLIDSSATEGFELLGTYSAPLLALVAVTVIEEPASSTTAF